MIRVPSPRTPGGLRELLAAKLEAGLAVRVEHTGPVSGEAIHRAVIMAERVGSILGRPVSVTVVGYGRAFDYYAEDSRSRSV